MNRKLRLAACLAVVSMCARTVGAAPPIPPSEATFTAASVTLPDLNVSLSDSDLGSGDKYFYFHRGDTSFDEALADIRNCDDLARGIKSKQGWQSAPYPYAGTLGGMGGELIGNMMVALIVGSAEERKMRRSNMRRCMSYKGYDRFALPKNVWSKFNFEEALKTIPELDRQRMLAQQAKAASGPQPTSKALGK